MNQYKKRSIILINEETGDSREFESINAAARFINAGFSHIQRAALYNGTYKGWKVYESPDAIRQHISDLEQQLRELEG